MKQSNFLRAGKVRFWHAVLLGYMLILGFLSLNPWLRPESKVGILSPDKFYHALAYGGLAVILCFCFEKPGKETLRNAPRTWVAAIFIAVLTGILIEVAQSVFTSNREGSMGDVLANTIGACLGYAAYGIVKYINTKITTKS